MKYRALAHDALFLLVDRLPGRLHDARVNHLTAVRHIAMDRQLAIDRVKNAFAGASLDQAFFEGPDRSAVEKLMRSSSWNSICSSLKLNSC